MNLIYLHGFQSSPLSMKGQLLYAYVQQYCPDIQMHLPDLNAPPLEVLANVSALIQSLTNVALEVAVWVAFMRHNWSLSIMYLLL